MTRPQVAYTNYPLIELGDEPYEEAPVREVEILDYDGNKYCNILREGLVFLVKIGYLYSDRELKNPVFPSEIEDEGYPSYTATP